MDNDPKTLQEIYKLINDMRVEIAGHILRLESKFDILEAGRVSGLEKSMAELKAQSEPVRALVYGLVSMILIAVIGSLIYLVIKRT